MMYTKYKTETGEIISNFITSGSPDNRIKDGESYIEGCYDPALFVVVDGEPVESQNPPVQPLDLEVDLIRAGRDELLAKSDWTQLPDAPLSDSDKEAYRQYRQALRDIPAEYSEFEDVIWPRIEDFI